MGKSSARKIGGVRRKAPMEDETAETKDTKAAENNGVFLGHWVIPFDDSTGYILWENKTEKEFRA